jgi:hypothetical protein
MKADKDSRVLLNQLAMIQSAAIQIAYNDARRQIDTDAVVLEKAPAAYKSIFTLDDLRSCMNDLY